MSVFSGTEIKSQINFADGTSEDLPYLKRKNLVEKMVCVSALIGALDKTQEELIKQNTLDIRHDILLSALCSNCKSMRISHKVVYESSPSMLGRFTSKSMRFGKTEQMLRSVAFCDKKICVPEMFEEISFNAGILDFNLEATLVNFDNSESGSLNSEFNRKYLTEPMLTNMEFTTELSKSLIGIEAQAKEIDENAKREKQLKIDRVNKRNEKIRLLKEEKEQKEQKKRLNKNFGTW